MFRFELNEIIYYMADNKIHGAPVLARMMVENAHPDWNATEQQREMYQPFGRARVVYATCHGTVDDSMAFYSAQELADSLVKEEN